MSDVANAALVELTSEIAAACVAENHVRAAETPALLSTVHAALAGLGAPEPSAAEPEKHIPPVSIRRSVTDDHLVSREDGKRYQSLERHLSGRGLTPAEYRAKWGLSDDYPMVSPAYARKRSELAKSIGLGSLLKRA